MSVPTPQDHQESKGKGKAEEAGTRKDSVQMKTGTGKAKATGSGKEKATEAGVKKRKKPGQPASGRPRRRQRKSTTKQQEQKTTSRATSAQTNINGNTTSQADLELLEADVCYPSDGYPNAIRIYQCIWRPEKLAHHLCNWERQHGIDQCVDLDPESTVDTIGIPLDANFIIVGDSVMAEPVGSVVLFCRMEWVAEQNKEVYKPVIGFFWTNVKARGIIWSLNEYFADVAMEGATTQWDSVTPYLQNRERFEEIFGILSRVANRELRTDRMLSNLQGQNRCTVMRWRANVEGFDEVPQIQEDGDEQMDEMEDVVESVEQPLG